MSTLGSEGMSIVRSGIRRPKWICRNVGQNAVLVRDRSGSMDGQKAQDASAASLDLVAELANPVNKDGFRVAIVDFSGTSQVANELTKATELNTKVTPLSPGGSTNITAGLEDALRIITTAEQGDDHIQYLRPVVLLFSDGCHNGGDSLQAVADAL